MQRLNLNQQETTTTPTTGSNPAAASPTPASSLPPGAAQNVVSEAEAIGAAANTNIPIFSANAAPESGQLTAGSLNGTGVAVGSLIDGKTAVELMDAVLPAALVFVLYKGGMQMRKTELQLTQSEKNTLAPLMQRCMDVLLLNFDSPFVALGVSMTFIYGAKIMEKGGVAWLDKQTAEKVKAADVVKQAVTSQGVATTSPANVTKEANGITHSLTEDNISAFAKERKVGRAKGITQMLKLVEQGKMDKFGKRLNPSK